MGRWEPNARGRLQQAALELYAETGFEDTTVADIAGRAGLTERTFFRHFADKREVLFWGSAALQELFVQAVVSAPEAASPLQAVGAGLAAVAELFGPRREHAQKRQQVIDSNAGLRERELIKLAALADAVTDALRGRGVGDPAARLTAESGLAVFKIAFERWVNDADEQEFGALVQAVTAELKAVTAG